MTDPVREVWVVEEADGSVHSHGTFEDDCELTEAEIAAGRRVARYIPAESRATEGQGGWVPFDMSDPKGPDIDDQTTAWIVWKGVVQEQPWIWDHHDGMGPAWLCPCGNAEPDRVVQGVSHYMPVVVPKGPTNG